MYDNRCPKSVYLTTHESMKILNRSESPVILPEKPWELETDLLYSIAVLPDPEEDRLRLYYLVRNYLKKEIGLLCVAYSEDGYSWTRPEFSDGTNIVMRPAGPPIDYGFFVPFSVLYDPWETEMGDRWKMIYWDRPGRDDPTGICLAVSPDGLHWRSTSRNPIITASNDAASLLCTDPDLPKPHPRFAAPYFIYQQTWRYDPSLPQDKDLVPGMRRQISLWRGGRFSGEDGQVRWRGPFLLLAPDEQDPPDTQFYWLCPFRTRNGYRAFLNVHHTIDQTMDAQMVSSADGMAWERLHNRTVVLPSRGPGWWDCGMVKVISPPVYWKGRTLVFYNGRSTTHDWKPRYPDGPEPNAPSGIGVAEIEPDWAVPVIRRCPAKTANLQIRNRGRNRNQFSGNMNRRHEPEIGVKGRPENRPR